MNETNFEWVSRFEIILRVVGGWGPNSIGGRETVLRVLSLMLPIIDLQPLLGSNRHWGLIIHAATVAQPTIICQTKNKPAMCTRWERLDCVLLTGTIRWEKCESGTEVRVLQRDSPTGGRSPTPRLNLYCVSPSSFCTTSTLSDSWSSLVTLSMVSLAV